MKGCDTASSSENRIEAEKKVSMADPIGTIKNISEIIKKYNDLELMKQIVSLQTEVFELQTENLALKKDIAGFNEREKITRREPEGYYYKEDEIVPHCPKCWEKDGKAITLPATGEHGSYVGRVCRVCNHFYNEGRRPETVSRRTGGPWS
jgi:hypothetical protein